MERRMGGLVACFVEDFLRVVLGVDRCRLEAHMHYGLLDGYRHTLESVVPEGLILPFPPINITWFHYDDDEDEEAAAEEEIDGNVE